MNILGAASIAMGTLALAALAAAIEAQWREGPPRLCPGVRVGFARRAMMLIRRSPCGYDLAGSPADPSGAIRCPECGARFSSRRRLLRAPLRARLLVSAVTLTVLAVGAPTVGLEWLSQAVRLVPTMPLLVVHDALGAATPTQVRWELRTRFDDKSLSEDQRDHYIAILVNDLRADSVHANALSAAELLESRWPEAVLALQAALDSDDYQQRQIAANILRRMDERPVDALLRVTIEGLRDDGELWDVKNLSLSNSILNAVNGVWYLHQHAGAAEPLLIAALDSSDQQQRYFCAALLGFSGCTEAAPRAAPILVDHLRDNEIDADAAFAMRALWGFGSAALPALHDAAGSPDPQQRRCVEFLMWKLSPQARIGHSPPTLPHLTVQGPDPTMIEFDELEIPRFP